MNREQISGQAWELEASKKAKFKSQLSTGGCWEFWKLEQVWSQFFWKWTFRETWQEETFKINNSATDKIWRNKWKEQLLVILHPPTQNKWRRVIVNLWGRKIRSESRGSRWTCGSNPTCLPVLGQVGVLPGADGNLPLAVPITSCYN